MSKSKSPEVSVAVFDSTPENASEISRKLERDPPKNICDRFVRWIEIDGTEGLSLSQLFLYNYDLKPVEAKRRTWRWWNYINFWVADAFNVNTWEIASTGVAAGLSWWVVWITVWLGYFFVAVFVTLSSKIGTNYHISFPVSCRSSFGIWGSLWPVLNRVVMACVWFGVQSSIGGNCVELMLKAIFGNDLDTRIHNTLKTDAIDSFGLLSFFIFWVCQLPFIYMRPHTVRHLFTAKAILCPIAGFGFLIWTLKKAGGGGPVVRQGSTIHGGTFFWAFINSTMNALGNYSTLVLNSGDFTRMARTQKAPFWTQLVTIPIIFSITCLIGILVSSASTLLFGETYWDPTDVLSQFLSSNTTGTRVGVFFIALGFAIAQAGTNIAANSISAGTDATALLPRFMSIRRGGFMCAVIGFAICPWNLMTSSSMFTTYLSAYAVFLSAIAGVIFSDYYLVKKGFLKLRELYVADKSSSYFYSKGFNWRAYAAYLCGILPNIVGFVGATETHTVPIGATRVYDFSYFVGYASSAIVYFLLNVVWPESGMPCQLMQKGWFEEWQDVEDFDKFFAKQRGDLQPIETKASDDFIV